MYEVIYMRADFEPWWMFEGWEDEILSRKTFTDEFNAVCFLEETLSELRSKHQNESMKKTVFLLFGLTTKNKVVKHVVMIYKFFMELFYCLRVNHM